jgi:xylulokinase
MGVRPEKMLACGGGGTSALWRSMLADIYGMDVSTVDSKEAPALGVAILAMVGTGIYASVPEACGKILKIKTTTSPVTENTGKYKKVYAVYKSLYPHLKEDYESLAAL